MIKGRVNLQGLVFKDLFDCLDRLNKMGVRYQLVDELPGISDVVDRRSLYLLLYFVEGYLLDFKFYTCVSGVWVLVENTSIGAFDIGDFLGRV